MPQLRIVKRKLYYILHVLCSLFDQSELQGAEEGWQLWAICFLCIPTYVWMERIHVSVSVRSDVLVVCLCGSETTKSETCLWRCAKSFYAETLMADICWLMARCFIVLKTAIYTQNTLHILYTLKCISIIEDYILNLFQCFWINTQFFGFSHNTDFFSLLYKDI